MTILLLQTSYLRCDPQGNFFAKPQKSARWWSLGCGWWLMSDLGVTEVSAKNQVTGLSNLISEAHLKFDGDSEQLDTSST